MKQHQDSHVDHVPDEILSFVLTKYEDREGFFIDTFELPDHLPELDYALYGPICGDEPIRDDECILEKRNGRNWTSRMVDRPVRKTRTCTVVAGPFDGDKCVLYTVYGGPAAPREPGDPSVDTPVALELSTLFWAKHALARNK